MNKRVVITGMGIYSCIGTSLDEVKDSLYQGKSGISFDSERKEFGFQSALTGIGLPGGSKRDGRILSVASAGTLLETESNKTNTKVQNTEVLVLPPASLNKFNKDSLVQRLTKLSWKITPAEDNNYL